MLVALGHRFECERCGKWLVQARGGRKKNKEEEAQSRHRGGCVAGPDRRTRPDSAPYLVNGCTPPDRIPPRGGEIPRRFFFPDRSWACCQTRRLSNAQVLGTRQAGGDDSSIDRCRLCGGGRATFRAMRSSQHVTARRGWQLPKELAITRRWRGHECRAKPRIASPVY